MLCLFCKKEKARVKYCSMRCGRNAHRIRTMPNVHSSFKNDPKFWDTTTGKGFKWEQYIAKLLNAEHIVFNIGPDLDWKGKSVDVKCSKPIKRIPGKDTNNSLAWIFNRGKYKPIDFFACVCLIDDKPHKVLLVPGDAFPRNGMAVGYESKYDKYSIPFC